MAETIAVARAKGIALPGDIESLTLDQMGQFPPSSKPSMLEDMEAGRPLELEYLSGAIVRFGKALGVPTPVHEAAYRSISSVEPADRSNVWLGPLNDTRADPSRKDTGGLFRSERTVEEGSHEIGNA